jgi:hypothetical protein
MLKNALLCFMLLGLFSGCDDKGTQSVSNMGVEQNYQNAIQELILKGKNPPKEYQALSWKKLSCSEVVTERLHKRALFIAHRFKEKHIYGGEGVRENIYFIGNDLKPSLIINFDVKKAFAEFLGNTEIEAIFASVWDLKTLHVSFQKSASDAASKEAVKDFIYAIRRLSSEDQMRLERALTQANTPMSIDKNYAIFMSMRLFPELIEELLFNEITYKGKYAFK